ncbi:hypothetical protein K2173_017081 [Erythroxylum novogranatense]|uniref:Uncharacterized protein n=1 Tax=Erythroxylum novogranatense TaxID=1862640 RepID=A0AAV8U8H5_9ROSI|nr:hypothetical protein K2173_017081 [Erythroxylum novogranatense]
MFGPRSNNVCERKGEHKHACGSLVMFLSVGNWKSKLSHNWRARQVTPFPASCIHQEFFKPLRSELRSVLRPLDFRFYKHIVVQCTGLDSSVELGNNIGLLYSFLAEIGIDENGTRELLERNPALKLVTFGSMRARVVSLRAAGIHGIELKQLVTKAPVVLIAEEIDPFIHYVLNVLQANINPTQLKRVLGSTKPRFLVGFDQKVKLLIDHGVSQEKIPYVLNNANLSKALCRKSVEEIDRTLSYLSRYGGADIIVKRPAILNYDLDARLVPRIEFLRKVSGGDVDATAAILRKAPVILSYSLEHMKNHVEVLKKFAGLSDHQVFKILLVFPNVISVSKDRKLQPRIEFLKKSGLKSDEIFKFLTKAPLFLALSFESNIAPKLVFLLKIGYECGSKELVAAMGAVTRTSCENLQKVIELFFSYGLSCGDILAMSKRHPQILQYSYDSLEEKMEYLIEEMGREVGELLSFPAYLGYKLDDRIKHRYEVKKKTLGEGLSINKLLSVSTKTFSDQEKEKPVPG